VSVLCALGLELRHTVQGRRPDVHRVAVMVREELDDLPLLVGREHVQQAGGISTEPDDQTKRTPRVTRSTLSRQ